MCGNSSGTSWIEGSSDWQFARPCRHYTPSMTAVRQGLISFITHGYWIRRAVNPHSRKTKSGSPITIIWIQGSLLSLRLHLRTRNGAKNTPNKNTRSQSTNILTTPSTTTTWPPTEKLHSNEAWVHTYRGKLSTVSQTRTVTAWSHLCITRMAMTYMEINTMTAVWIIQEIKPGKIMTKENNLD